MPLAYPGDTVGDDLPGCGLSSMHRHDSLRGVRFGRLRLPDVRFDTDTSLYVVRDVSGPALVTEATWVHVSSPGTRSVKNVVERLLPHILMFATFAELFVSLSVSKSWCTRLSESLCWRDFCVYQKLPVPIVSFAKLREYVRLLHVMRIQWLEYKPFAHLGVRRMRHPARCGCAEISHVADNNVLHARAYLRPLSDTLHGLVAVLGALPNDYVSAMEAAWSPNVTLRLGEVELIRAGVLVFEIMHTVTEKVVACIGRTLVMGTYLEVLFMSYRVDATGHAIDLSYKLARPILHNWRRPQELTNFVFYTFVEMIGALVGEYLDIMQRVGTNISIPATPWNGVLESSRISYGYLRLRNRHSLRYYLARRLYRGHGIKRT